MLLVRNIASAAANIQLPYIPQIEGEVIRDISSALTRSKKILIFTHANPDTDAYTSTQAMAAILKGMNKEFVIFSESPVSRRLSEHYTLPFPIVNKIEGDFSTFIALDCSGIEMFPGKVRSFLAAQKKDSFDFIRIEHDHPNIGGFPKEIALEDSEAFSAGTIVYYLAQMLGIEIDSKIATLIITGILTDNTMIRKEPTISQFCHNICRIYQLELQQIDNNIFDKFDYDFAFIDKVVKDLEIDSRARIGFSKISRRMLRNYNFSLDDALKNLGKIFMHIRKEVTDIDLFILSFEGWDTKPMIRLFSFADSLNLSGISKGIDGYAAASHALLRPQIKYKDTISYILDLLYDRGIILKP